MSRPCEHDTSCGISPSFPRLSPSRRQIGHVLLTRPPLGSARRLPSYDLHVLGTPPAFVLSQDQTLHRVEQLIRTRSVLRDLWGRCGSNVRNLRWIPTARALLAQRQEGRSAFPWWARPLSRPRLSISLSPRNRGSLPDTREASGGSRILWSARGVLPGSIRTKNSGRVVASARCEGHKSKKPVSGCQPPPHAVEKTAFF